MENLSCEKDRELWKLAKKRVSFKRQLTFYLFVNAFLWLLWALGDESFETAPRIIIPWPLWSTIGWGIGIVFSFYSAYGKYNFHAIENEFAKLKSKI